MVESVTFLDPTDEIEQGGVGDQNTLWFAGGAGSVNHISAVLGMEPNGLKWRGLDLSDAGVVDFDDLSPVLAGVAVEIGEDEKG